MGFIRIKSVYGNKYAYDVTSYWDPKTKTSRQKSKYLGIVNDNNKIISKSRHRAKKEPLILDFGNGYLLHKFIEQLDVFPIFKDLFDKNYPEVIPLIFYKLIMQSAMYNCDIWFNGNIIGKLYPKALLSSQNISRVLALLSDESLQRHFFSKYIELNNSNKEAVIIDATSLPNQISSAFNAWGHSDGSIEKQFRLLCVISQKNKIPLFYRYLPGNITDISTLNRTIAELSKLGIKNSYVLMDAGYFSKNNVKELYEQNIHFLSRLPATNKIYKTLLFDKICDLEKPKYATKFGNRGLFIKNETINLYGKTAYAYIVLDPTRKGKEINELLLEHFNEDDNNEIDNLEFNKCGIMVLISSYKINNNDVVSSYYTRQSIEQIFGYCKDDLSILPIRKHNDNTIQGYLFLQFLTLIVYLKLREKLLENYTVEQILLILRNLKCKIYDNEVLISEQTKEQKLIFNNFDILVPKNLGI